ncbi:hypothetical protein [Streptomyces sp. NPDC053367]
MPAPMYDVLPDKEAGWCLLDRDGRVMRIVGPMPPASDSPPTPAGAA